MIEAGRKSDSRRAICAMMEGKPIRPVAAPIWESVFACGVVGKRYASDVTADDLMKVAEICGFDPILRLNADALWADLPQLQMETQTESRGELRRHVSRFACPAGAMEIIADEPLKTSATCTRDGTHCDRIYDIIEWYYRQILDAPQALGAKAKELAGKYRSRSCLFVGWMTPFELSFLAYPSVILTYLDNTERHHELMELHMELVKLIIRTVAEAGWDGFYTAGPPVELIGMKLYEELATSYLRRISEAVHEAGMWFNFHNCGHIRKLLVDGTYNHVGLDLFETLAPPPMGELDDLRWAREQLDESICTRGNMDLEFLKNAAPEDIARRAAEILRETAGYRHMVGTADDILADTPIENVRAMVAGAMGAG